MKLWFTDIWAFEIFETSNYYLHVQYVFFCVHNGFFAYIFLIFWPISINFNLILIYSIFFYFLEMRKIKSMSNRD